MAAMVTKASRFDQEEWDEALATARERGTTLSAELQLFVRNYPAWAETRCRRKVGCVHPKSHKGRCEVR